MWEGSIQIVILSVEMFSNGIGLILACWDRYFGFSLSSAFSSWQLALVSSKNRKRQSFLISHYTLCLYTSCVLLFYQAVT